MSYQDPVHKVVVQPNGRMVFANGFGGVSTIEPKIKYPTWDLDTTRSQINQEDKAAHGW